MCQQQLWAGEASGARAPVQLLQSSGVRDTQRRVVLYKQRCASGTSGTHAGVLLL